MAHSVCPILKEKKLFRILYIGALRLPVFKGLHSVSSACRYVSLHRHTPTKQASINFRFARSTSMIIKFRSSPFYYHCGFRAVCLIRSKPQFQFLFHCITQKLKSWLFLVVCYHCCCMLGALSVFFIKNTAVIKNKYLFFSVLCCKFRY